MLLGNPKGSGGEDWGTLGKIRGITTPRPLKNPIDVPFSDNFSIHVRWIMESV